MRTALAALVLVGAAGLSAGQAPLRIGPSVLLASLSSRDMSSVAAGEVVSRAVDSDVDQATVSVHAMRLAIPVAHVIAAYAPPGMMLETANAIEFGEFGAPPIADDLAGLSIDDNDLGELAGCRPGDCKLKLDLAWMQRFRTEIDWRSNLAPGRARDLYADLLSAYAARYAARGNMALTRYHDKRDELRVAEQFEEILRESAPMCGAHPKLCLYLRVPFIRPEGLTRRLLWMKEDIGASRRVTTLVDQIRYQPPGSDTLIVATKQLYGNHYYEAALALTWIGPAPNSNGSATDVVHLLRARIDALRGWGLFHGRIHRGVRNGVSERMEQLRLRLEDNWASAAPKVMR